MYRVGDKIKVIKLPQQNLKENPVVYAEYPDHYDVLVKFRDNTEETYRLNKNDMLLDGTYETQLLKSGVDCYKMKNPHSIKDGLLIKENQDENDWYLYRLHDPQGAYRQALNDVREMMNWLKFEIKGIPSYRVRNKTANYKTAQELVQFMIDNVESFEANSTKTPVSFMPDGSAGKYVFDIAEDESFSGVRYS